MSSLEVFSKKESLIFLPSDHEVTFFSVTYLLLVFSHKISVIQDFNVWPLFMTNKWPVYERLTVLL